MRILVVEDDPDIGADVENGLQHAGFVVDRITDGTAAWFAGDTEDYALAILDLGLPQLDGLSVLKRWRQAERRFPVLILSARGDWTEKSKGSRPAPTTISPSRFNWANSSPGCAHCCAGPTAIRPPASSSVG